MRALEGEILNGTLGPGERLDERALAARFGVSRAPVRDAVGRLASLGLIEVKPRSGSYVATMSAPELFQFFEVMAGLEGLCAFYAAQRMDADEQTMLMRTAEQCVEAARAGMEQYVAANRAFHDLIYRGAQNDQLKRLTRQARQRVGSYRNHTFRLPGRLKRSAEEHLGIAEKICTGDALQAQQLMARHVDIKRSDFAPFIAMIHEANAQER
ncbi:MAG: GntR family transcriptional regulator [Hyphomicrobiaceae bacterium]